jgi:hypothetical protein
MFAGILKLYCSSSSQITQYVPLMNNSIKSREINLSERSEYSEFKWSGIYI